MEINQEKRDLEGQDSDSESTKRQRMSSDKDLFNGDRLSLDQELYESNKTIAEQDDSSSGSDSDTETGSSSSGSSSSGSDNDDFAEALDNELFQSSRTEANEMEEETIVEEITADTTTPDIEDITADEIASETEAITGGEANNDTDPGVQESNADETTKESSEIKKSLVDESIRGPSSTAFFFSRDAYEAYSTDSIESIVNRHVKWVKEHKEETEMAYKRYFRPPSPESSTSTPIEQAPSPAVARVPAARSNESPSSSPAPSSTHSNASNPPPDVLDSLLSSMHSETKPKQQHIPTDIAVAAVSLSQPLQEETVILGDNVKNIYQALCDLDCKRIQQYPRYYAHYSHIRPPVFGKVQALKYNKNIATLGKIAYCKAEYTSPEKINMRKSLIQTDANTEDHYCKKPPLTLSQDRVIGAAVQSDRPHIVTTLDTLVKIVEIPNDLSVQVAIPITVKEDDDGNKTVYLDLPLMDNEATVHNQNQAVFDLAFKSHGLEWDTRQSQGSDNCSNDKEAVSERNMYEDEHLRYGLWSFGDMPILIRHQVDGLLKNISNANCQVFLKTFIKYKNMPAEDTRMASLTRARYWIRSYLTGHGKILEGKIDVDSNLLTGATIFHMRDIMKDNWTPSKESEFTRQLFQELHGSLKPGNYLLHKTSTAQQTSILQSVPQEISDYDLYDAYGVDST